MHLRRKKSTTDLLKEQVSDLTDQAADLTGRAVTTLAPKVESARDAAVGAAGNVYETASTKVRDDYAARVREQYVPRAREAAAPAVAAAMARANALASKVEPEEKKSGKFKKLVLLLGLGGAVAFVLKKLGSPPSSPPPHPARVRKASPPPAPAPAAAAAAAEPTSSPPVDRGNSNLSGGDTASDAGR